MDPSREQELHEHERAFRRAGLPTLIEDYSAAEDVFTRGLPVFAIAYTLEILNALNADFSTMANAGAFVGGLVLAIGAFGVFNLLRGRRFFSVPRRVGTPELAAFVLLPALLPLVFDFQWRSALVTVGANLVLVGLVYLVIGFGVIPILLWVGARFLGQLRVTLQILVRAVPILVFFALIVFFAAEVWEVFATVSRARYLVGLGLFVGLGSLFLAARVPAVVEDLERGTSPLSRRQRLNVGLIVFLSYGLQVLFVSAAVWIFFMAIGAVLMDASVQSSWTGGDVHPVRPFGVDLFVTEELLRVATGMAAISGLYYSVALVVDPAYRDELSERLTGELRETFARREEYLRLVGTDGSAS